MELSEIWNSICVWLGNPENGPLAFVLIMGGLFVLCMIGGGIAALVEKLSPPKLEVTLEPELKAKLHRFPNPSGFSSRVDRRNREMGEDESGNPTYFD